MGPGLLLEQLLGNDTKVVMTLVCGDNYAVGNQEAMIGSALEKIREAKPDRSAPGPCFQAGGYGMAAGALSSAGQGKHWIPVVTGMAKRILGSISIGETLYIIDSGNKSAGMRDVLGKMSKLAAKRVSKAEIGLPAEEGYLTRGLIRDQFVEQTAAQRLVDMVLAKVKGEQSESEMVPTAFAPIPMPPGLKDLSKAKVMLITDGGLVPKGNPDKIQGSAATRWGSYRIEGCNDLEAAKGTEISHGGYDPQFVQARPGSLVPLDAMRELEREGVIGKLHDEFISTSGLANPLSNTRRMGREMAERVKQLGVDAVILTST